MRLHILGICGTFMAGVAVLAKQAGHEVSGSDSQVYPPMSTQLQQQGISLCEGYKAEHLMPAPDLVIIGNALSRGNPAVEYVLNQRIPYLSGPEWLAQDLLHDRKVLAIAGTHGKTTTTAMVSWILECAGLAPGFLIGGVPQNFTTSARKGQSPYFVIEADEYDSAFFDKRSKFLHYRPTIALLNNLEYDHADIFPNIEAIKQQFQFLLRTVPGDGLVLTPSEDSNLLDVLQRGCWSQQQTFSLHTHADWQARLLQADGSEFVVLFKQRPVGEVRWQLLGEHNVSNAIAAIGMCHYAGVAPEDACLSLASFKSVKRRLEVLGAVNGITVYDDFAHHPTAILTTLTGLRKRVGNARIHVILQLGSYTMKTGVHGSSLAPSLQEANTITMLQADNYDVTTLLPHMQQATHVFEDVEHIVKHTAEHAQQGDHIVVMSNRGFDGIHQKLLAALSFVRDKKPLNHSCPQ